MKTKVKIKWNNNGLYLVRYGKLVTLKSTVKKGKLQSLRLENVYCKILVYCIEL